MPLLTSAHWLALCGSTQHSPDTAELARPDMVPIAYCLTLVPAASGEGRLEPTHVYLVQGLAAVHQNTHGLSVLQALFQLL